MRKKMLVLFSFLAATSLAASSEAAENEMRTHYVVADRNRLPVYRATVITTSDENAGVETCLLSDVSGERVRIDIRRNHVSHLLIAEYSVNNAPPVKVKVDLPFKSMTRSGNAHEYNTQPELREKEIPFTIESNGKMLKTAEREWKSGPNKANVRAQAKSLVGTHLAATMTKLRSVLAFPPLAGACSTLSFVTDGVKCAGSTALSIAVVQPDCDFDATFGFPCSAAQAQRANSHRRRGSNGSY